MPKRILILGGSGFVGSYLANFFKPNFDVSTTSSTGKDADLAFDVTRGDFTEIKNYDYIINCIVSYENDLDQSIDVNVKGTFKLLEHLCNKNCHYINISSVSAASENFHQNIYSFAKHLTDEVVSYYRVKSVLKLTTLRFAQIYDGEGHAKKMQPGLFYFAEKIKQNEPLTIFGDKNKKRSYIPIEVLCKSVFFSLENGIVGNHNVIMPDNYSSLELANIFSKMTNWRPVFGFDEGTPAVQYSIPECSPDFIPIIEMETNLPYFKILFDNV